MKKHSKEIDRIFVRNFSAEVPVEIICTISTFDYIRWFILWKILEAFWYNSLAMIRSVEELMNLECLWYKFKHESLHIDILCLFIMAIDQLLAQNFLSESKSVHVLNIYRFDQIIYKAHQKLILFFFRASLLASLYPLFDEIVQSLI